MSKGWDNSMLKKLKALTGKGLSTSEIGKRLGMSKNAIVGKLNRLGWNAKAGGAAPTENTKAKSTTTKKTTATVAKTTTKKTTPEKKTANVAKPATATKKAPVKKEAAKKTATKAAPKKSDTTKKATEPKTEKKPAATNAKTLAMHQRIVQHALEMANLKPNQCRWPIGDPDSEHFHFCGETVFVGKPYCYEHCKQAYQFTPPKKK